LKDDQKIRSGHTMFASKAVILLIEQLVINTKKKNGFSHSTMSLQQWLKFGSVKVKAPVTPGLPHPSKGYVFLLNFTLGVKT
jgi:hypothetical protein